MNTNFYLKFEKEAYPTGKITPEGEHLHRLTINASSHIPPVGTYKSSGFLPIFIPTNRSLHRNRGQIRRLMQLASQRPNALLIFLCSLAANKEAIETIAKHFPSLQWIAFDGPFLQTPAPAPLKTNASALANHNGNDLPQKRNFALRLAQQMHWNTIFLLDDDVDITNTHLDKACDLLQAKDISLVGFNARKFPDHSVAMHAYRWANNSIDNFICGGALAIKTNGPFTSLFPHIYNEDWIFMLPYRLLKATGIAWAGTIKQRPYNPYKNIQRVLSEEAGDILAESMYKLAFMVQESGKHFKSTREMAVYFRAHADCQFWDSEISNRLDYLRQLCEKIQRKRLRPIRRHQALRALNQSIAHILDPSSHINGKMLADWVGSWCDDLERYNQVPIPKKPRKSIPEALKALDCSYSFLYSGINLFPEFPLTPLQIPSQPKDPYLYHGYTVRPRTHFVREGLWLTKTTQDYLKSRHLPLERIAISDDKLRFDRPTRWYTTPKPNFTICMIVGYGESIAEVRASVQNILKSVQNKGACQLVICVYHNKSSKMRRKQLDGYRNQLVVQLVHDLAGTNLYLRSGILASRQENLSAAMDGLLDDISFAYWKEFIRSDHPIFVTNSRNELLRFGTFCQFIHHEQQLPRNSLHHTLQKLTKNTLIHHEITPESDAVAIHTAKTLLVRPQRNRSVTWRRPTTASMIHRMKKARLTWLEQDDLAYSLVYHNDRGPRILNHIKKIICIPVSLDHVRTLHHEALATKLIAAIDADLPSTAYFIVIQGATSYSWEEIDKYRENLLKIIQGHVGDATALLSMSYRLLPDESARRFKSRILSSAEYAHWLQNHSDIISITWDPQYAKINIK